MTAHHSSLPSIGLVSRLGMVETPRLGGEETKREVAAGHEHDERAAYDIHRLKTVGSKSLSMNNHCLKTVVAGVLTESNSFDVIEPLDLESRVVQLEPYGGPDALVDQVHCGGVIGCPHSMRQSPYSGDE